MGRRECQSAKKYTQEVDLKYRTKFEDVNEKCHQTCLQLEDLKRENILSINATNKYLKEPISLEYSSKKGYQNDIVPETQEESFLTIPVATCYSQKLGENVQETQSYEQ